ncbi:outer membrane protein assembly factor BamB family protein [Streptomyces abikoensis]|uniref:PQQ-binding-like beta-propeller repeat protein n=1 Tax=Streptomyces abikoensis TaxID=97398 RepID=A0ABW7T2Z2_9ACTN
MTQPPSYGYPQQPPSAPLPPTPPSPGPTPSTPRPVSSLGGNFAPHRPPWRRPAVLIGLVVVLLLAAGGWALWSFTDDGRSKPKDPNGASHAPGAGTVAWLAEARVKPDEGMRQALGTWFTSTLVVKAEPDVVTAYDIKTGEKKWSFLLTGSLCAASRESEGNVAVVAVMFGNHCMNLKAIDLRDGHRVWNELLMDEKEAGDNLDPKKWGKSGPRLALHDGHVYTTWKDGEQTRNLSDGKRVDQRKQDACEWADTAGGKQLIAITYCGESEIKLRSLDPKKLDKPKWSSSLKRNDGFVSVISTDPLVLSQSPGKGGQDNRYDFVVLDPATGKEKTRVAYNGFWRLGSCFLSTSGCTGALVDKDSLYVAGQGVTMAYDLTTGRERWTYKSDANRVTVPTAVHDGELATYVPATAERRGRLDYVSTADGKVARVVEHSDREKDRKNESMMAKVTFPRLVNGRLLLINDGGVGSDGDGMILAISAPDA